MKESYNALRSALNGDDGFTLVELAIVVMVCCVIILIVGVSVTTAYRVDSRERKALQQVGAVRNQLSAECQPRIVDGFDYVIAQRRDELKKSSDRYTKSDTENAYRDAVALCYNTDGHLQPRK